MRLHLYSFEHHRLGEYSRADSAAPRGQAMRQNRVMDTLEPGPYVHFKGGHYDLVGEARHSETEERLAVYRSADGSLWVRPLEMFLGEAIVDGVAVPRFVRL